MHVLQFCLPKYPSFSRKCGRMGKRLPVPQKEKYVFIASLCV
jgi:hypothetical protein